MSFARLKVMDIENKFQIQKMNVIVQLCLHLQFFLSSEVF